MPSLTQFSNLKRSSENSIKPKKLISPRYSLHGWAAETPNSLFSLNTYLDSWIREDNGRVTLQISRESRASRNSLTHARNRDDDEVWRINVFNVRPLSRKARKASSATGVWLCPSFIIYHHTGKRPTVPKLKLPEIVIPPNWRAVSRGDASQLTLIKGCLSLSHCLCLCPSFSLPHLSRQFSILFLLKGAF